MRRPTFESQRYSKLTPFKRINAESIGVAVRFEACTS
jgi:hypothetical protein